MQIQLRDDEIETAVREYIKNMGIAAPVQSISFSQTRNPAGFLAEVEVGTPVTSTAAPVSQAIRAVDSAPKEVPEKIEAEPEVVAKPTPEADSTDEPDSDADEKPAAKKKSLFGG